MKKLCILFLGLPIVILFVSSSHKKLKDFISQESPYSVEETMEKLQKAVEAKGLKIFTEVKHDEGAKKVNLTLNKTRVLLFGNPKAGTVLMNCDPRIGLMLPLKVLVWEDQAGKTQIGYLNPDFYSKNYQLDSEACQGVVQKMKGLLQALVKEVTS